MAYYKFADAILAGRPIDVNNYGELWRDFTYVDDVVESVVRLAARPAVPDPSWKASRPYPATSSAPWRIYNIGNHRPVKLTDFIALLESALGRKATIRLLPMQDGDVLSTCADTEDLQEAVGFSPSTSLADGLVEFVRWHRQYHGKQA
jgi:UDP-glucuronate 4-epimerase